ncbi:unnamed protein product, partial [Amoebophrya sp. A25]|eukprot:GSA25T00017676001.1
MEQSEKLCSEFSTEGGRGRTTEAGTARTGPTDTAVQETFPTDGPRGLTLSDVDDAMKQQMEFRAENLSWLHPELGRWAVASAVLRNQEEVATNYNPKTLEGLKQEFDEKHGFGVGLEDQHGDHLGAGLGEGARPQGFPALGSSVLKHKPSELEKFVLQQKEMKKQNIQEKKQSILIKKPQEMEIDEQDDDEGAREQRDAFLIENPTWSSPAVGLGTGESLRNIKKSLEGAEPEAEESTRLSFSAVVLACDYFSKRAG